MSRGPITPFVLKRIEERVALMRWSEHLDDEGALVLGSLADEFWNKDVPRLLAFVRAALVEGRDE